MLLARLLLVAFLVIGSAGCTFADDLGTAPAAVDYRWRDEPFAPMTTLKFEPPGRGADDALTLRFVLPELPRDPAIFVLRARGLERATVGGRRLDVDAAGIASLREEDTGRTVEIVFRSHRRLFPRGIRIASRERVYPPLLREDLPVAIVGVLLALAGACMLALGARRDLRGGAMSAIGAFCVPLGVAFCAQASWISALLGIPADPVWTVHGFATLLYPLGGARFFRTAFDGRAFRWAERGVLAWVVVAAVLHVTGIVDVATTRVAFYPVIVALALAVCVFLARRARAGDGSARILVFGMAGMICIAWPDIVWGMGVQVLPFNVSPFGALVFVLAMVLVVERRYVQQATGLERSRVELEERVAELTQRQAENEALDDELRRQVERRSRELADLLAVRPAPASDRSLVPGVIVDGRYRVVSTLGVGAMGAVYEVERTTDAQRLALKVMLRGTDPVRFAREAEIAARARHPNIVSVVDVGVAANGLVYLVMELVRGETLEAARASAGGEEWAGPILGDVAAGLAALHDRGIVHRDLKPSNVLLDAQGTARIADFGVARQEVLATPLGDTAPAVANLAAATAPGAFVGTPLYMAPENARGAAAVGPPADVFALGIIAAELLGGVYPYGVPPVFQALTSAAPRADLSRVAPPHLEWVAAALDPDPARRPTAAEIAARFGRATRPSTAPRV